MSWNVTANCELFKTSYRTGKTSYERRLGEPFCGPTILFGSTIEYHPNSAKDQSKLHQFGKKVLPGIFQGYVLFAEGIWQCYMMVSDTEELDILDASEINAERLNAKEVLMPKNGQNFIFPIADGTVKYEAKSTTTFFKESRTGLNH